MVNKIKTILKVIIYFVLDIFHLKQIKNKNKNG
jgi:hypothetical protein